MLQALMEIYPDAPIYTLLCEKNIEEKHYKDRTIFTSIIQRLPGGVKFYQWYLPLMPMAVEFFDLTDYDLVISDTSSFAKGVITSPHTLHICYCHTPTRYLWSDTHEYIKELKYNKYFKKIISLILNYVRLWDRAAADRVDEYIANSSTVVKRIKKYYKSDSVVIYPPVEVDNFGIDQEKGKEDYFLAGCRLTPYKRMDLVVEAFKKNGRNLKIFGDGPDKKRLEKIAGEAGNIEFLGRVSDEKLKSLYSRCSAFLNPQEEDFGITCVEAMASGRPVIAYRAGGARETIIENKTGIFFNTQNVDSLNKAIEKYDNIEFNPYEIKEHAHQFSKENFQKRIQEFAETKTNEFWNDQEKK